jgi:hypothetical protein
LASPYDIAAHYEFESKRSVGFIHGVHEISSMKPAMLGPGKFDQYSPTKLFKEIPAQRALVDGDGLAIVSSRF